ncbi:MAG: cache domain-containing protein, partial [Betaproteobacteria bacterium]
MKLFLRFAPTARAGLVGLALVGSLAYNLVHERTTAIEGARTQTQNFARVLEEHARQTLHRVGSNLARADVTLGRLRAAGVVDRSVLGKELSDELPSDQLIRSFLLLDATGAVVLSTRAERAALPALMAQRDFFVPHVRGADRELVFGAVQKDADDGRWLLPVSRRIGTPAGSFVGVLVAMVDTGYFQSFYDSVDHGGDGFLTLFLT